MKLTARPFEWGIKTDLSATAEAASWLIVLKWRALVVAAAVTVSRTVRIGFACNWRSLASMQGRNIIRIIQIEHTLADARNLAECRLRWAVSLTSRWKSVKTIHGSIRELEQKVPCTTNFLRLLCSSDNVPLRPCQSHEPQQNGRY